MASPAPQNDIAVEFLLKWLPEGPWVLTAIQTDRKSIDTRTFRPSQRGALSEWLQRHNGKDNIYFHVNPPTRDLTKKADREDIASLSWLHVDIDPRAGEDLEEERRRALGLLTDRLPKGVPEPTVVIFSGGGYQGFWRLEEPLKIDGNLELAEDAKLYNVQLEILFGADNCHNIDRIMRLPGTINIPDAKKRKKGRTETLAELISFNDNSYSLEDFKKAPALQTDAGPTEGGENAIKVEISGEVERIQDVSELDQWDVGDRVKIIMVQGRHPDQPKEGDNSRSAWLYDFCCQMVRSGVPDEVIFAIITDADWGISESVLEHKANAEKYALRQIQRAKENAIDPWLAYFNQRYLVVKNLGGKCLVMEQVFDPSLKRNRWTKRSLDSFQQAYENKRVQIGEDSNGNPKYMPAGKWWRFHENRKQFETIVFAPEQQLPPSYHNLWQGFAAQSIPGDCALFLEHVRENICAGNEEHYQYLMGWMARAVQKPAELGEVAIVLRGGRGTGKSFFAKEFGALFGQHYMQVSNSSHLVGNFNSHLRDLVVLFADEAFYAADKKHESTLKTLITENTMPFEAKGVDIESGPNYIHLIMASNDMHVVPAGQDERRFFILDVGQDRQKDTAFFRAVKKQLEDGGREALLYTLLHWDLDGFNVREVPDTIALREQKLLSLTADEEWWYQKLVKGQVLYNGDGWPKEVLAPDLMTDYREHTKLQQANRKSTETKVGLFLKKIMPRFRSVRRMVSVDVPSGDGFSVKKRIQTLVYTFPPLEECRAYWETLHGKVEWPEGDEQGELTGGTEKAPF